ncbi:Nucleoporin nup84 [Lecanora helva]
MPPLQPREESWNSLHHSEASGDNADDDYSDVSMDDGVDKDSDRSNAGSPSFPTIGDVHRALHPLQATADRVGRQVEQFAENLDRLSVKKKKDARRDCSAVLPLINAYQKVSRETVEHLETMHAPEKRKQLSKRMRRTLRSSSGRTTPGPNGVDHGQEDGTMTSVDDLKYWEQEEQTWELLGLMLQAKYPAPASTKPQSKQGVDALRPKNLHIHHYSSEKDVWQSFLATNDQAWERRMVLKWLQDSANKSGQEIEQVVEELESGADRGSGLWAHSWLYSKEAIKGQKRLRSWPKALEPDSPGLNTSLLNVEKTQALITQLDPDAITRQVRSLEKQDQFFERAMWLACWEMTRRGKDWAYIREWCEQRVENWRAIAMHGDPPGIILHASGVVNWQSRALWRKTCALAAKEGGIDEYESAVYGVLSGYLPSVLHVSRSWDDHLFAHYNSYLLYSFDNYVKDNFADRVLNAMTDQHSSFNFSTFGGQREQSGIQLVEKLKHLDSTKNEARTPIKMLQGSLIAGTFDDFVFRHGARLAKSANADNRSKILAPMSEGILEHAVTADLRMTDHDLLRLITHVILIHQDLGFDFGTVDRRHAMENIIVAYIDYLGKAGKQQLLPLYAARLSPQRSITCLGRQLPSILDRGERQTFMRLMTQEGIDVPSVLSTQLIMIIADTPTPDSKSGPSFPNLRILEPANKDNVIPRQIHNNFIGDSVSGDQQDLIRGFEWYLLLDGHWRETMMVGTVIYKHLLRSHALAAARRLSQIVTFSTVSLNKTKSILGNSMDLNRNEESDDEDEDPHGISLGSNLRHGRSQQRRRSSSVRRVREERNLMLEQASTFRDLEHLFATLDAMEEWAALAKNGGRSVMHHDNESVVTEIDFGRQLDPRHSDRKWKNDVQEAYNRIERSVQPLLHNWLQGPNNGKATHPSLRSIPLTFQTDTEAVEFPQIRKACLPEVVLAYLRVLDSSSRILSRDLLIRAMDLAAVVAAENSDLGACFMAAGRMPELVDSFAFLGQSMIRADDMGPKGTKSKKKKNGETLSLWSVRASSP